ncbi:MAG: hypothetical protein JNM62_09005 [Flavobacteriales bacterium]|nr:hypothetical protein [Flavobacteriales bacterium]
MKERYSSITQFLFALGLVMLAAPLSAQYFRQSSYWKTQRQEVSLGFGISNFLGELGGRNQIGSPFVWDLELSQTRPAAHFDFRYYIAQKMALRARATYGVLAGNDNLTSEPFRQNRNLSFKSDIYEFSLVYEFHLYKEELGHMYDLRGVQGTKSSRVGFYFFAGVGGFYFDPKAQLQNTWVRLKPLGTEGQGLPGGAEEYNNLQVCIPMGVGVRKAISKTLSAGLELQYTKTFTDYIDDVSTNYYDNDAIRGAHGDVAGFLADPSLGVGPLYEYGLDPTAAGQQRGDSDDLDAYIFLKAQVHYKLIKYKSGSKKYRTRIRRQKIVF